MVVDVISIIVGALCLSGGLLLVVAGNTWGIPLFVAGLAGLAVAFR